MIPTRRLITCEDIFMADLVLQYCIPKLSCKELTKKKVIQKKAQSLYT